VDLSPLESQQPLALLVVNAGLRFTLISLSVIALYTSVGEVIGRLRSSSPERRYFSEHTYALFYVNRALIAGGILLAFPAAMYRYGIDMLLGHEVEVFVLAMCAQLCFIAYFLISETLRLVFSGHYTLKRAIRQSWLFVIAAIVLAFAGAYGASTSILHQVPL